MRTFGVKATVVSSSEVATETIFKLVEAIFENLEEFRAMHPAFGSLQVERMVRDGLSAALHKGAENYYRGKGLR